MRDILAAIAEHPFAFLMFAIWSVIFPWILGASIGEARRRKNDPKPFDSNRINRFKKDR